MSLETSVDGYILDILEFKETSFWNIISFSV